MVDPTGAGQDAPVLSQIEQVLPNPFNPRMAITDTVANRGFVFHAA